MNEIYQFFQIQNIEYGIRKATKNNAIKYKNKIENAKNAKRNKRN